MRPRSVLRLTGITVGCIICVAVLAYAVTSLARGVYMTVVSSSWLPREATVHSIHSHAVSADLYYLHHVHSNVFQQGNTFAFLSVGAIFDKQLIEKSYRVGDKITVHVDPGDPGRSVAVRRSLLKYVWVDVTVILLTCVIGWHVLRRQTALLLEDEKTTLSKRTLAWIALAVSGVVICLLTLSNDIPRSVRLVMASYVILVACLCFAALGAAKCAESMRNDWARIWAGIGVLVNVVVCGLSVLIAFLILGVGAGGGAQILVGLLALGWFWGIASALRQIFFPDARRPQHLTSLGLVLGLVASVPLSAGIISIPSIWGPYELDLATRLRYWFPLPNTVFYLFLIFSSFGTPRPRVDSNENAGPSGLLDEFRKELPPGSGAS
jgi:hypothetical protein